MNKKHYIQKGTICTYDPNNTTNLSTLGPINVQVIRKTRKVKFVQYWSVMNIENNHEIFTVPETLLYPCNIQVIRYPSTMPIFTEEDLNTLEKAAVKLQDQNLCKIREKILLSLKLREI